MPITCNDLLKLNSFRNIKLLAGEAGLYRTVMWPYTVTTSSVSQWLHGGELLFTTGIGLDADPNHLKRFLEECIQKNTAGLVVIVGNQHIPSIPENLIEYANENDFPLFSMPWKLRLIDVTREVISAITASDDYHKKLSMFTEMLIFSKNTDEISLRETAVLYGLKIRNLNFLCTISVREHSAPNSDTRIFSILKDIFKTMETLCQNQYSLAPMYYSNEIICFCSAENEKEHDEILQLISAMFQLFLTKYSSEHLTLSFSSCYSSLTDMYKCWKEVNFVNDYITCFSPPQNTAYFDKLGVYKFLYHYPTSEERKRFYIPYIGKILEYDAKNSTELLLTLKYFIKNNGNLIKTADELFIHRNTLIYRISVIKKILNNSLEEIDTRLVLYISIIFYEFDNHVLFLK